MTIEFPQELIDAILDLGDSGSLKASSLVCRAWLFRSRSHLFEHIRILPSNILVLRELLRSPICTLLPHVCSIEAIRHDKNPDDRCFDEIAADLRRLTQVRILETTFKIVRTPDMNAYVLSEFLTAFPKVERLVLNFNLADKRLVPLVDVISLFPALHEVKIQLHNAMVHFYADANSAQAVFPPRGLRRLDLAGDALGPILAWLRKTSHLPNVDSVTLPSLDIFHEADVHTALQFCDALNHLDLDLTRMLRSSYSTFPLSLRHNPNLISLTIRDTARANRGSFDPNPMFQLIATLAAPALERVVLDFSISLYGSLNWAALDEFLCPERFPRLRSVMFICSRHLSHKGDSHDFLCGALPLLEASGVLRMEW